MNQRMNQHIGVLVEQLCRRPSGGIGVYAANLSRSLAELGEAVVTISSRSATAIEPISKSSGRLTHRFVYSPHALTVQLLAAGIAPPGWKRATSQLSVVHATSFDLPPMHAVRTQSTQGTSEKARVSSAFVHDLLWKRWPDAYSQRGIAWHERALERALRGDFKLLVPSVAVQRDLLAAGADSTRVFVTGEGSDHLPHIERSSLAGASGFLLSVATNQPRKNLPGLMRAYEKYRRTEPLPLDLKLVGPQGWGSDLPALPAGVELLGSVSDVQLAYLYSTAAALVYVPFEEGFGLPVVEAWRARTPVIASDGVPVAGEHPAACVLVDPHDGDAIAAAMARIRNDAMYTDQLCSAAAQVVTHMTWMGTATAHVAAWRST